MATIRIFAIERTSHATPWEKLVELYDVLIKSRPSPVVALNRAMDAISSQTSGQPT